MQRGWNAQDLLLPLWRQYPGGREALASAAGTSPNVLSSVNSGKRPLGHDLGGRLAAELGVSLLELGAPVGDLNGQGQTLVDRLAELEERHTVLRKLVLDRFHTLERELELLRQSLPTGRSPARQTRRE